MVTNTSHCSQHIFPMLKHGGDSVVLWECSSLTRTGKLSEVIGMWVKQTIESPVDRKH